jgi:hypothetical protein
LLVLLASALLQLLHLLAPYLLAAADPVPHFPPAADFPL